MIKNKIVIITPFYPPNVGGVETHLKYYTDFLAEKNINAAILTYKPLTTTVSGWKKYEKINSVEIYRFWWWGKTLFEKFAKYSAIEFLYMVPKLLWHTSVYSIKNRKEIKNYHAHGLISACIVRLVTIFIKRKKVVSTHFIYNLKERGFFTKIFLWIFNDFDLVLAVGKDSKKDLMSVGYPENKIKIYRHSIDNQILFIVKNKHEIRKKYSISDNDFVVLFVGRLLEMKGVVKLVNVAKNNPNIKFVFVGSGVLEGFLRDASRKYSNIILYGKKFGKDLVDIYNLSDVVALPSTEEGSSLVVIEALSCGKPVIVTKYGCSKDMFPDNLGKKIEPTEQGIKDGIQELQKDDLQKISIDCREFALNNYSHSNLEEILNNFI